jgi:hypothetical protein
MAACTAAPAGQRQKLLNPIGSLGFDLDLEQCTGLQVNYATFRWPHLASELLFFLRGRHFRVPPAALNRLPRHNCRRCAPFAIIANI